MIETTQSAPPSESAVSETPPATASEPTKEQAPSKFDVMAQKEKQYVRKMQAMKLEAQKVAQQRQEIEQMYQKVQEWENAKKQARLNPDKYLEAVGLNYDEYTQYKINNNNPSYEAKFQSIEEKIDARFREQEEREQKRLQEHEERTKQSEEQAVKQHRGEIKEYVEANKDKYKYVHVYEGHQLMEDFATEYAKRTNKVIPMEQAAQMADDYLREQWLKGKALEQAKADPAAAKPSDEPRLQAKSLSSSMGASVSSGLVPAKTDRERMERALAKLG